MFKSSPKTQRQIIFS